MSDGGARLRVDYLYVAYVLLVHAVYAYSMRKRPVTARACKRKGYGDALDTDCATLRYSMIDDKAIHTNKG